MKAAMTVATDDNRLQFALSLDRRVLPWQDCYDGKSHRTVAFGALWLSVWYQRFKWESAS